MKLALAQINTTVGDISGNVRKIVQFTREAIARGAQLVIFPELALSGYPPQDLVERESFLEANLMALQQVADAANGIYVAVGHVGRSEAGAGKRATNSASIVSGGRILCQRNKTLLPTYDVFDEARLFRPAESNDPVRLEGLRLGVTICEDAWNDRFFWQERRYEADPVEKLAVAGVDLILNLSASPFSAGKQHFRRAMLVAAARRHGVPIAYVNCVGGNDQLVFDGRSMFFDRSGQLVAEAAAFQEDLLIVESGQSGPSGKPELLSAEEEVWEALRLGLADYARKCGFSKAVLGVSGGVDSALVAALAAATFGPQNVTALFMPTTFTSERSWRDVQVLARNLGIELTVIPIEGLRLAVEALMAPHFANMPRGTTEENIQARLRGLIVMAFSNKFGHLPLTTGNKSELAVGYCTLYGDMAGGLAVIGDVPKTLVYELARKVVNRHAEVIPASILERAPSAELKPDQTDQDVLPPYELLDAILFRYIEESKEYEQIVAEGFDPLIVRRVLDMVDRAEYKRRQAPPTIRVTSRAFGFGRQLPIAQGWRRGEAPRGASPLT